MPVRSAWVSQHLMQRCMLLARKVQGAEYHADCRMTELGHGSNVMGIETQATYDEQSMEFVITTPRDTASKFWIGGAAQHGKVTPPSQTWPDCYLHNASTVGQHFGQVLCSRALRSAHARRVAQSLRS